jgi:hypothetical protein
MIIYDFENLDDQWHLVICAILFKITISEFLAIL